MFETVPKCKACFVLAILMQIGPFTGLFCFCTSHVAFCLCCSPFSVRSANRQLVDVCVDFTFPVWDVSDSMYVTSLCISLVFVPDFKSHV